LSAVWKPYLVGIVTLVGLAVVWALVQGAWRKTFPERSPGGDALAGRLGCSGCTTCDNPCDSPPAEEPAREEKP
jgi:hypothetical protein